MKTVNQQLQIPLYSTEIFAPGRDGVVCHYADSLLCDEKGTYTSFTSTLQYQINLRHACRVYINMFFSVLH
jgi:hypothetical protein